MTKSPLKIKFCLSILPTFKLHFIIQNFSLCCWPFSNNISDSHQKLAWVIISSLAQVHTLLASNCWSASYPCLVINSSSNISSQASLHDCLCCSVNNFVPHIPEELIVIQKCVETWSSTSEHDFLMWEMISHHMSLFIRVQPLLHCNR